MVKTLNYLFPICFLICGCNYPKAANNNDAKDSAEIIKLNDVLKKFEEPSQIIKVSTDIPSVVTGRKGSKISVNPSDLVTESGKPLGQSIEIELKELTSQGQLLGANAQTVSGGKLLVSGGAYFIGMTSNGERLKLKEGKRLGVQLPKLSEKEMALFYGQRNDLGQMDWRKANETFKAPNPPQQYPAGSFDTIIWDDDKKSDIDKIMDYVDSSYNPTPEEKERNIKQRKNYIVSQKVYDEIGIDKLGWINCDRFYEVKNITELYATFRPEDSVRNANVYLIFKNINSVMQGNYFSDKSPQFVNIPVGYKARLIAYTVKDEKVFAYSTDLIISNGQKLTLDLKEISDLDFKRLIGN